MTANGIELLVCGCCHWCCGRSKDTGKCTGTAAGAGRCGGGDGGGFSPPASFEDNFSIPQSTHI